MGEEHHICEACRHRIDPSDPGVVRAVELIPADTFGGEGDVVEGLGVFFHREHFPVGGSLYRIKE